MNIQIQHVIGTVALIGLVISASLCYEIFTSFAQNDNRRKELGQISEDVALNIEEMINLVKFAKFSSYYSNYTVKIIDLPIDVGGKSYQIQLLDSFKVHAFLTDDTSTSADSTIPFNLGDIPLHLNTTAQVYKLSVGIDNTQISCSGTIYGKNGTIVWAYPDWRDSIGNSPTNMTVGIGWVTAYQS